ncbi:MAG: MFS transporter, partial [Propionibacteriaceae bacterium]|nr:MFS transporter [Propionibacteriaceae bacterium]
LWFAGLTSILGDWMLSVALPITVYKLTGSALTTAGIVIARLAPSLLFGSVAGVFVDRWDSKRTMVIANLIRAPVLLLLLTVDSAGDVWTVYVVAFVGSTLGQFFSPAENSLLPELVGPEHLIPANALNTLNNNLARLIGPAVGGVVAGWYGLNGVVVADAATFLAAAGMIALIAAPARPAREARLTGGITGRWATLRDEWVEGMCLIRRSRTLGIVFGVYAISSFGEGLIGSAFPVYVSDVLDGGPREAGWLMSGQAVGGFIGAFLVGSRAKTISPLRLLAWGAIGTGTFDLLIFTYPTVIPGVWLGVALFVVVGLPITAFSLGGMTAMQAETEDAYRGRVFGALNTTMALLIIVAAAIAGFATDRFGAVAVLSFDGLSYIVSGIVALRLMGAAVAARTSAGQPGVAGEASLPPAS